ncbi:hypothetical protein OIU78_001236 [Salix suchowensis]|nr:hypothetical protein OIU78_001236 [Salix suchowensis]
MNQHRKLQQQYLSARLHQLKKNRWALLERKVTRIR